MAEGVAKKRKVGASTDSTITDSRFANIQSDPRYRLPSKKHRVKLDKRFSRALQDDEFSRKSKVDRYGRQLDTDSEKNRLKRKYEFEEDEGNESDGSEDDEVVQRELEQADASKKTRDLLREGRAHDSSSSSDSSSEEEEDSEEVEDEAELAPQTRNDVPVGEVSSRLAVVNLDWDNIRAEDLMAVFSSFLDSGHKLQKVAVYPSEFGRGRMQREEMEGPPREIFAAARGNGSDVEAESGDEGEEDEDDDEAIKQKLINPDNGSADFDSQALRRYQLDRLRYFYAILTFSSPQAAKIIYDAVDGTEYLSTANFFDLRFVPDDTDFSSDTARDECETISTNYKPNEFITDALQHSKVKLTWDAEDTNRKEAAARAFRTHDIKDLDDVDLAAYIGSDSSDNESVHDLKAIVPSSSSTRDLTSKKDSDKQKMRALLGLGPEPPSKSTTTKSKERKPVGNVEITFSAGLTSNSTKPNQKRSVFENSPEPDETTIEKYVRKEKERKARRREKAKAAREEGKASSGINHDAVDSDAASTALAETNSDKDDLGFDDPFFTGPSNVDASQQKSKLRKEERLKKRQEREAEEELNRQQRAQLELLMADDVDHKTTGSKQGRGDSKGVRHFDMREIAKEEKRARKAEKRKSKGKDKNENKKKTTDGDGADDELGGAGSAEGRKDGFAIDPKDARFKDRLFGSYEFAIDPTNPRYGATKGMETLLQEARRRKAIKEHGGTADGVGNGTVAGRGEKGEKGAAGEDVRRLVEKIKKQKV